MHFFRNYALCTFPAVAWFLLIVVLTAKALISGPTFAQLATEPCPQLLPKLAKSVEAKLQSIHPSIWAKVIVWRDATSREEISPYRRGEQALTCATLEAPARLLSAAATAGIIRPQMHVNRGVFSLVAILPALALFVIGYSLQHPVFIRRSKQSGPNDSAA